jgi:hypothetical protein
VLFLPVLRADRTSACNLQFPIYVEAVTPPKIDYKHFLDFGKGE